MRSKALHVTLSVQEPSVVELNVGERVQLDRLFPAADGCVAERHGELLEPGATIVTLDQGHYLFKTLSDSSLRIVSGGVASGIGITDKDEWPDPPTPKSDSPSMAVNKGDDSSGETPHFRVIHSTQD